jgi:iron complex transport system ATP-binding protein
MQRSYLTVRNLGFSYRRNRVLRGVNCTLNPGEVVSVIGPNGAGKTTLLRCMLALQRPSEGSVVLEGTEIERIPRRIRAVKQGYVPQQTRSTFGLTVMEMVLLGRKPHMRFDPSQRDLAVVEALLVYMNLLPMAERTVDELSGGERQKVMLARALAQEPDALFLDEPTSALDIRHQIEVMERLRDLVRDQNKLVVMILHDLALAARYSDRLLLLHQGHVHAIGSAVEVLTPTNLRAVYGVEAQVRNGRFGPEISVLHPTKE